jgi:hypothetical protein
MAQPRPLAPTGAVFLDPRGVDRSLRVSWHSEADVVVLSLWRDNVCTGTFRLAIDEVPDLIDVLRTGLHRSYVAARDRAARADALGGRPGDEPGPGEETRPIGVSPAV